MSIPSALPADVKPLTARELEVLRLIADGKSNDEVGTTLVVSTSTLRLALSHLQSPAHAGLFVIVTLEFCLC